MPFRKSNFTIERDDLTKAIDVDDSAGRSVPINMNFTEENFLTKDSGFIVVGQAAEELAHSIYYYRKKDGTRFLIRASGSFLQYFAFHDRRWYDLPNTPIFTPEAQFGYEVYDDTLYLGNGVESLYSFNGSAFTAFGSAPKGNILAIFEDRLFIAGVTDEPLSAYYSNTGDPETYTPTDVLKPLGTDHVTGLVNYFGQLLIFKQTSIWRLTFIYDQVVSIFVPKLEIQNSNYGACSRQAITWAENDVWFFTGTEVRSIGYKDQQIGQLGVNASVISDAIKQSLATIKIANHAAVVAFYHERRFYLSVLLGDDTDPTLFVCHLLHRNAWTKYVGRDKARMGSAAVVDGIIYSTVSVAPYGVIKWLVEEADAEPLSLYLTTEN